MSIRFKKQEIKAILLEAKTEGVKPTLEKFNVKKQTYYSWRKRFKKEPEYEELNITEIVFEMNLLKNRMLELEKKINSYTSKKC